jgi:hypothetical protein
MTAHALDALTLSGAARGGREEEEVNRSQASLPMMKAMLLGHLVVSGGNSVCESVLISSPFPPLLPCSVYSTKICYLLLLLFIIL